MELLICSDLCEENRYNWENKRIVRTFVICCVIAGWVGSLTWLVLPTRRDLWYALIQMAIQSHVRAPSRDLSWYYESKQLLPWKGILVTFKIVSRGGCLSISHEVGKYIYLYRLTLTVYDRPDHFLFVFTYVLPMLNPQNITSLILRWLQLAFCIINTIAYTSFSPFESWLWSENPRIVKCICN